jgi:hypothetical protein
MAEDHLDSSIVGEALNLILKMQFQALRDGDRYYYENDNSLTVEEKQQIKATRLSQIILRNTEIETLQDSAFKAVPRHLLSVELFPFPEVRNIELKAYPNPVQKYFNLIITNNQAASATLRIINANGKIIEQRMVKLSRGKNELNFELDDNLANGLYTITLSSDSGVGQLKLIRQK